MIPSEPDQDNACEREKQRTPILGFTPSGVSPLLLFSSQFFAPMTLTVNQEPCTVQPSSTLFDILLTMQMQEKQGIAVAVNDAIVARHVWMSHELKENDTITIIQATQGG
jgi:sulfur carrier protein